MAGIGYDEIAVMDEDMKGGNGEGEAETEASGSHGTPIMSKTRSLSDGGGTQLSPSPHIIEASRRTSKDDSSLVRDRIQEATTPVTPRRPDHFPLRGLSLQMPQRDLTSPAQPSSTYVKPTPLSPKLDHSQIYASPTNILPRRSRGLDFSRAATSLHHSTLAEQSSPDSSPTIGGRAMNIPGRANREYGADQTSTSLWSIMGNQERMNISGSVGSTNPLASDSSSSSGDDDYMDDEMEDAIMSTPQVAKTSSQVQSGNTVPWMPSNSPAVNSLSSFRTRPRKQSKQKFRGLAGLGFKASAPPGLSKSPPNNVVKELRDIPISHSRRESISWAANQLHISGSEMDERIMDTGEVLSAPGRDGARGVIKRTVTRRGNLLPKTKGFARIRAALAEENTPVDSEVRREAEVIRQVRESDMDLEPRVPPGPPPIEIPGISTDQPSPNLATAQEGLEEVPDDDMMTDSGFSSSFKQQAMKNYKGKNFWETFSETSSVAGTRTTTPPPAFMPRGSSSGISEDVNMDSPSLSTGSGATSLFGPGTGLAIGGGGHGSDSQRSDTPQANSATPSQGGSVPPTAAEITRRINNKRRRDDDFDPHSFKRRAVSPGMSVHNSPVMQSPMQRDVAPWGSRPGSTHGGDKASGTPSENGSSVGNGGRAPLGGGGGGGGGGSKGRVGFQGMVDTNDGLMRMSIE